MGFEIESQFSSWHYCFLCSSPLDTTPEAGDARESSCVSQSRERLVLQYLLNCKGLIDGNQLYNDVIQYFPPVYKNGEAATCDEGPGVQVLFCACCKQHAEKLSELQVELDVLQMRIREKVKEVKAVVISNSRLYGNNNAVRKRFERIEKALENQEDSGGGQSSEKRFLEVLHNFQTHVFENDNIRTNIPLVYLKKCSISTVQRLTVQPDVRNTGGNTRCTVDDSLGNIKQENFESVEEDTFASEAETDHFESSEFLMDFDSLSKPLNVISTKEKARRAKQGKKRKTDTSLLSHKKRGRSSLKTAEKTAEKTALVIKTDHENVPPPIRQRRRRIGKIQNSPKASNPTKRKETETEKLERELKEQQRVKKRLLTKNRDIFKCDLCEFQAKIISRHEMHLRIHETLEKHHTCPDCKNGFTQKQYFDLHTQYYCGAGRWKCDVCEEYVSRTGMKEHFLEKHDGVVFECENCGRCFGKFMNLVTHFRSHKSPVQKCLLCAEATPFQKRTHLLRHLYEVHGHVEVGMRCEEPGCSRIFFDATAFAGHKNLHAKIFACDQCEKAFYNKKLLAQHVKQTHENIKLFHCDLCPAQFSYTMGLEHHKVGVHNFPKYKCKVCSKEFVNSSTLYYHMGAEHSDHSYNCELCGKQFTNKQNMERHQVTHSDAKNFTCEICGFATKTKDKLTMHRKRHDGEKKFVCSYCPKSFLLAKYLKIHLRVHTLERPYQCDICGSGFSQRVSLKGHMRRHHGVEPPPEEKTTSHNYVATVAKMEG